MNKYIRMIENLIAKRNRLAHEEYIKKANFENEMKRLIIEKYENIIKGDEFDKKLTKTIQEYDIYDPVFYINFLDHGPNLGNLFLNIGFLDDDDIKDKESISSRIEFDNLDLFEKIFSEEIICECLRTAFENCGFEMYKKYLDKTHFLSFKRNI